jgi:hypothetical protein
MMRNSLSGWILTKWRSRSADKWLKKRMPVGVSAPAGIKPNTDYLRLDMIIPQKQKYPYLNICVLKIFISSSRDYAEIKLILIICE